MALAVAAFGATTLAVWAAETWLPIDDASPVYLVAVVATASLLGTTAGIVAAVAAFLIYDFLFIDPRLTLIVASSREWLDLLLFLFVAIVVGRLVGLAAGRAESARASAVEAEAVARVSRELATRPLAEALREVGPQLAADLDLDRLWIELDGTTGAVVADTGSGGPGPAGPRPTGGRVDTLVRDGEARWISSRTTTPPGTGRPANAPRLIRVRIERGDQQLGAIVATTRVSREIDAAGGRLLGLAADVIALAIERDRRASAEAEREVARQADELKSRLVTSVSHDLRTPLAAIRAASGTILDRAVPLDEARSAAATIDAEAERLDRMVRGLLDLGRIEAGTLHPRLDACDLGALVDVSLGRLEGPLGDRPIDVSVGSDLPPVLVDELLFDHVLGNLLENVARHAPAPAPVRISARAEADRVGLVVEDGGPGLSRSAARALAQGSGGNGVGLMVVRAFAAAMSIDVSSGVSRLGGLAVTLRIPVAEMPPGESAA